MRSIFFDGGYLRIGWFVSFVVAGVIAAALLLTVIILLAVGAGRREACDNRWPDRPHRYEFFGGCLVEWNGQMIPQENIGSQVVTVDGADR